MLNGDLTRISEGIALFAFICLETSSRANVFPIIIGTRHDSRLHVIATSNKKSGSPEGLPLAVWFNCCFGVI